MKAEKNDIIKGFAGDVLKQLEQDARPEAAELRDRLRSLVEDYSSLYLAQLAGVDVTVPLQAVEARAAALRAAGSVFAAGQIHAAIRTVLMRGLDLLFKSV
jgi:hypothetical protein